jgi:predicted DNA-binding transcriptional regulator AlpA
MNTISNRKRKEPVSVAQETASREDRLAALGIVVVGGIPIWPDLLTEHQAAFKCGVSRSALAKARSVGKLAGRTEMPPYVKIGGRVRYKKADIDAWLADLRSFSNLAEEGAANE